MKKRPALEPDNGFEDHGGYMAAKINKLEEQFNEVQSLCTVKSKLFEGISIFVNGYTNPSAEELKRIMMQHSGTFHHYQRSHTKYIIASNLPDVKVRTNIIRNIVKPDWIVDCLKENRLLDHSKYLLYTKQNRTQPQIAFKPASTTENEGENESISNSLSALNAKLKNEEKSESLTGTAVDPNFLEDFLNNSRLHHIATLGSNFKYHINDLRKNHNGKFPDRYEIKLKLKRHEAVPDSQEVIMHIDMDCFFVSVSLKKFPHLKGLPVAVTHSKGKNATNSKVEEFSSYSEIASCSYEARSKGLKNGMFVGAGMKLCPELKTIPYDFAEYKRTAFILYNTIAKYTLDIEAVSCDELYTDLRSLLDECQVNVIDFVTMLRQEIFDQTGCTCSVGIGRNRLQARMATKEAKPNGQFELLSINVEDYMKEKLIHDLPGVGPNTAYQFNELELKTCRQLQNFPLHLLQQTFGKKFGESLQMMSKGFDDKKLVFEQIRKSVSVEVNYGIRFNEDHEVSTFLKQVAEELSKRLKELGKKGRHLTLKVMVRAKDASMETVKFMGHGIVEKTSKSATLLVSTDDSIMIHNNVLKLLAAFNVPPHELRGFGVQISKLDDDRKENKLLSMFKRVSEKQQIAGQQQTMLDYSKTAAISSLQKKTIPSPRKRGRPPKATIADKSNLKSVTNIFAAKKGTRSYYKRNTQIDPEVLAELPPDLIDEILKEYEMSYEEEEQPSTLKEENLTNEASRESLTENVFLQDEWRSKTKAWIDENEELRREDLQKDIVQLVRVKHIDLVYLVMRYLHRIIEDKSDDRWKNIYQNVVAEVQIEMLKAYGKKLSIPTKF